MQHLSEFLNSKKLPIFEILSGNCQITEKIDGNAFQMYNENCNIIYGKRGSKPNMKSYASLDVFDLVMNPVYYNAYIYLNKYKDILLNYHILNFEIFSNEQNTHIVNYNNQYKNDIVLLSGYTDDNTKLTADELKELASILDVSVKTVIWEGNLTEDIIKDLKDNKDNDNYLWNTITNICNYKPTELVEGIVLEFHNRILKIQNPLFHEKLITHLSDEKESKTEINLESLYDIFINSYIYVESKETQPLSKLIELYMGCELSTGDYTKYEKILENIDIISNIKINISMIQKYYNLFPYSMDDLMYPSIFKFILLVFRNKRKQKMLWCSEEYQLNIVNPFLEKYIFN